MSVAIAATFSPPLGHETQTIAANNNKRPKDETKSSARTGQSQLSTAWPIARHAIAAGIDISSIDAAVFGRTLRFGYRVHVVVRETEAEARAAASRLLPKLDATTGDAISAKSRDSGSLGVQRQAELRKPVGNEGHVEDKLWTGIGRARPGCGAARVGDPDQILAKLRAYQAEGIEAFILSG